MVKRRERTKRCLSGLSFLVPLRRLIESVAVLVRRSTKQNDMDVQLNEAHCCCVTAGYDCV